MAWSEWEPVTHLKLKEVAYHKKYRDIGGGVARITFNRPQKMNAMTNIGWSEISATVAEASRDKDIGVVVYTGAGNHFGVGGDMEWEADGGLEDEGGGMAMPSDFDAAIQNCLKPVIAAVNGYAIGGGHILHVLCDLSIASENARFAQFGPKVGSFDAGFGASYLARIVGEKKAREIWFLCRQYTAQEALEMGLVNKVVPQDKLEEEVDNWCREILSKSPFALKFLKKAFNADTDHQWGFEEMAMSAVRLYWSTDEAGEAKKAFAEKREPDFSKFKG